MRALLSKYFKGDKVIWGVVATLFLISILAVYSASSTLAYKYKEGNTTYFLFRHTFFLILGFLTVFWTHRIHHKYFMWLAQFLYIASILLLLITLIAGVNRNFATRWLTIPIIGIDFQTSDFAKFSLIIFLSKILSQNQNDTNDLKIAFQPMMIAIISICGLILPSNFSTAALLFAVSWFLLFIGRMNWKYLFGTLGIIVVAFGLFLLIVANWTGGGRIGTWRHRIESFSSDKSERNYQVEQAKIAIATGGIFGKGPGNSSQRNILPHPYSDFIYAFIIEEYGLLGGIFVLILYLYLLYRSVVMVRRISRTFPAFLVIGLTLSIVFQALANMAVAVNLIPVTGQTLPFVSMGGTSILFTSASLGIILSVSRSLEENNF